MLFHGRLSMTGSFWKQRQMASAFEAIITIMVTQEVQTVIWLPDKSELQGSRAAQIDVFFGVLRFWDSPYIPGYAGVHISKVILCCCRYLLMLFYAASIKMSPLE